MRYGQVVLGPAGSGKSTYCAVVQNYCSAAGRPCKVINLDPAAEHFDYSPVVDVRDLISVEEAMEELQLGPNGALVYCMEYLLENCDWLEDRLNEEVGVESDDEYVLFDCPGQIELYCHLPVMRQLVDVLGRMSVRLCAVYCLEGPWLEEGSKVLAAEMMALSAMVGLEIPHISIITKGDLVERKKRVRDVGSCSGGAIGLGRYEGQSRLMVDAIDMDEGELEEESGEEEEDEDRLKFGGLSLVEEGDELEYDDEEIKQLEEFKLSIKNKQNTNTAKTTANSTGTTAATTTGTTAATTTATTAATTTGTGNSTTTTDGTSNSTTTTGGGNSTTSHESSISYRRLIAGSLEPSDLLLYMRRSLPARFVHLNEALANLLRDFNMVAFSALFDPNKEDTVQLVVGIVDHAIQYGENLEPKEIKEKEVD
eukprot:GHVS01014789.1.p1 GENE.GHVS01014789.1~~GHVS01014789.1.p1  ORF type:complete len:425 (-),score=112.84 GHVS01014789.1:114-1388(-)